MKDVGVLVFENREIIWVIIAALALIAFIVLWSLKKPKEEDK